MSLKTSASIIAHIEEEAKREYLPIIGPENGEFLERLVREKQPCVAVEVGVMVGYATVRIARNLGDGCRLVGVEISDELARRAEANVTLAGLAAKVEVRRGDARELLERLPAYVDFAFLDAERGQYLNYLKKLETKMRPGATVVANISGALARLQPYLDHVRLGGRYDSSHHASDGGGFEVSVFRG